MAAEKQIGIRRHEEEDRSTYSGLGFVHAKLRT